MTTRNFTAFAGAALVLFSTAEASEAHTSPVSAFQKPAAVLKSAISAKFGCSWRPYQDAGQQCGDELVVLNQGANGRLQSVEITCPIRPQRRGSIECRDQVMWIADTFLPSWSERRMWVGKLFQDPPRKGRWVKTSVQKTTILAQTQGPADRELADIVFGISRGDPSAWDLPR